MTTATPDDKSAETLRKVALRLHRALDGGLDSALQTNGFELVGLSFKINPGDVLCTIRLSNHKGPMVAFVGSTDIIKCMIKATNEAKGGTLRYRQDRYAG